MTHNPFILIIEDSKDVAELYSHALESTQADIEIIRLGDVALTRLAISEPDIVLLDLKLSYDVSGAMILDRIRSDPRLAKTRVVVLTGHPAMAKGVEDLADKIFIKPIDIRELIDLVTGYLASIGTQPHAPS